MSGLGWCPGCGYDDEEFCRYCGGCGCPGSCICDEDRGDA